MRHGRRDRQGPFRERCSCLDAAEGNGIASFREAVCNDLSGFDPGDKGRARVATAVLMPATGPKAVPLASLQRLVRGVQTNGSRSAILGRCFDSGTPRQFSRY